MNKSYTLSNIFFTFMSSYSNNACYLPNEINPVAYNHNQQMSGNAGKDANLDTLLKSIKAKSSTIYDVVESLKKIPSEKAPIIKYYACKYLYSELAYSPAIIKELISGSRDFAEEKPPQELSKEAFKAALEQKLYNVACLIFLSNPSKEDRDNFKRSFEGGQALNVSGATSARGGNDKNENRVSGPVARDAPEPNPIENNTLEDYSNYRNEVEALKKLSLATSDAELLSALKKDQLGYAVEFTRRKVPINKSSSSIFFLLFDKISKDIGQEVGNLDIYLYIIRKYIDYAKVEDVKKFADAVDLILNSKECTNQIPKLLNPIKFIIQLIELATLFSSRFPHKDLRLKNAKQELIDLGHYILRGISSGKQMKYLLLDKDLESRGTLTVILNNSLIEFLNYDAVEEIAGEVWDGPYEVTDNPFSSTSKLWEIGVKSKVSNKEDVEKHVRKNLFTNEIKDMPTHGLEYSIWKHSAGLHVIFFLIEYAIITGGLLITELFINQEYYKMDEFEKQVKENKLSELYKDEEYIKVAESARDRVFIWFLIASLALVSSFRFVTCSLYQFFTARGRRIVTLEWVVNLILFITLFLMYIPYRGEVTMGIQHIKVGGEDIAKLAHNLKEDPYISILSAIAEFCLGLRIAYLLRYTDFLGPLITTMGFMMWKTVQFCVIYFVILCVFSITGSFFLWDLDNRFDRFDKVMFTLFYTSVAGLKVDYYDVPTTIFCIVFVFVVNTTLFFFFMLILNEVYSKIVSKSFSTLHNEILTLRDEYKPHNEYQFMVHSYLVFDVLFCIIFLPFYPALSKKQRESLNRTLLYVEYTLCFILILPVYILIELILLPVCYFMAIANKIKVLREERNDSTLAQRIGELVMFIFIGYLFLLFYLFVDIYYFTLHAFTHEQTKQISKKSEGLNMNVLEEAVFNLEKRKEGEISSESTQEGLAKFLFNDAGKILPKGEEMLAYAKQAAISGGEKYFVKNIRTFLYRFFRSNKLRICLKNHPKIYSMVPLEKGEEEKEKIIITLLSKKFKKKYEEGIKDYCARDSKGIKVSHNTQTIMTGLKELVDKKKNSNIANPSQIMAKLH
eukprot:TRINITY_DN11_c0_g2_i1.p1 TRINITY_DN11_c0_g2~~TRINITY_DN11_c0_g2_i1.p1  ORF type:complete len:1075 (+),score=107.72 TRINITY_DN11_c0_g2_i1:18428-21652(+)